jgi:hypothetical protein
MDSYARLDDLYGKQVRREVRTAMLANPKFTEIVDRAAQALISTCLNKELPGDSTDAGDLALHYLHGLAEGSNPELAAALVVSATRIFVDNDVIFSHNDEMLTSNRTYIDDLRRLIGQSNSAASEAIKVLESRAVRKP